MQLPSLLQKSFCQKQVHHFTANDYLPDNDTIQFGGEIQKCLLLLF